MRIRRPDRDPDVIFRAYGEAATAGSKVSGVAYRKDASGNKIPVTTADGRIRTFTKDSSGEKGKAWRSVVADAGAEVMRGRDRFDGPVYCEQTFIRARPQGHYGKRGLLPSSPLYPATRPDVLKHARLVEDCLSGIVWSDDARIVCGPNEKVYADRDEPVGVEVRVWALPARLADVILTVDPNEEEG